MQARTKIITINLRKEQSQTKISKGICTEHSLNKQKTTGTEKKSKREKTAMKSEEASEIKLLLIKLTSKLKISRQKIEFPFIYVHNLLFGV